MNSKIDNKEIIINDKAGKVIKEIFLSLFSICQINLEATVVKGSSQVFDHFYFL